jgi:PKD repeat protein
MKKHEGKNMKNNRFSIWKITLSIFTIVMALTLLSTAASASITVCKTPLGTGTPPATERLTGGGNSIDYTAVAASSTDPRIVQFKDLSKGTETYIRWDFGDGTSLEGTKITSSLKNPVHKYAKTGYYISCLTIKCTGYEGKLWVHKTIVIK